MLIRHKMDTQRKVVDRYLLGSKIVDPDLGVCEKSVYDTTTEILRVILTGYTPTEP